MINMNKFLIATLLSIVVAVASAEYDFDQESQLSILTTDEQEIAGLPKEQMPFEDFCLRTRDHVFDKLKTTASAYSSTIYKLFFNTAEELGQDAITTLDASIQRLSGTLRDPRAPIEPATDDVSARLVQAQEEMATQSVPSALLNGFKTTIAGISKNVANSFNQKVEKLVQTVRDHASFVAAADMACEAIKESEAELRLKFEDEKRGMSGVEPITYANIGCTTLRRVSRLGSLCELAKQIHAPVKNIMTGLYNPSRRSAPTPEEE